MTRTAVLPHPQPSFGERRSSLLPLLFVSFAAAFAFAWLELVPEARAGEWAVRSCSYGSEYIAPDGWEGQENYGFDKMPYDNCERFATGGGLEVLADGFDGSQPSSGQTWRYTPPSYATIAGGTIAVKIRARHGGAVVAALVKEQTVLLASCETPGCNSYERMVPVTAAGASELRETSFCFPNSEGVCPAESFNGSEPDGVFAAESTISSAQILLFSSVTPSASGFAGTLLNGTVTGTGTLTFTARDGGPGVYQARVKIDGEQVWSQTPNLNEGRCVSTGSYESARAFNYTQPCPTETAVNAQIDTASLTDGTHALSIEVENAAANTATVYTSTITTLNHPAATIPPPDRGSPNGTPASDNAILSNMDRQPKIFGRALAHSAVTISGRLTDAAGTPIKNAQVQLLQQATSAASPSRIAVTTTRSDGTWTLHAPNGPSRLLEIAYFSHSLDTVPAATLSFNEHVKASITLKAPRTAHIGRPLVFKGHLAGGYIPTGGESVQMEILYAGRWRTIEVIPTDSYGRWVYKYVFTLGAGASYRFRAVAVPNGAYPFTPAASRPVRIKVRG